MGGVDIVVPCYDAERTLRATLASALSQEGVASVVVVDDGSRDGSLALAQAFAPRVTALTGPNRGVALARNRGAAEGKAPWLLFLDSDDLLVPGTVAQRLVAAEESGADVLICDWEEFPDGAEALPGTPRAFDWAALREDAERATAVAAWAPPAAILYRRDLFTRAGGFRPDMPPIEDARMLFDAARHGARFAHAGHCGARYRIMPGSLSRANPTLFWTRVLLKGEQIEALWREADTLGPERKRAVGDIYDTAARALLRAGHPDYFRAVAARRRLGLPGTRHGRITEPLARLFGLAAARRFLIWMGRP